MITIKKPCLVNIDKKCRSVCDIWVDDEKRTVWFEVDDMYGKYLCTERADAYVIGLLNWAMRENHDICSEIPVTEELLYNINTILIPSLYNSGKALHNIKIQASAAPTIMEGKEIGTGCSCGIDTFSAIYNHLNTEYKSLDLTFLCINNVGAFNASYSKYGENKVKEERYKEAEKAAAEVGLPLIKTDSNFAQAFPMNHYLTHTYSSCFAVYMLQKMWKVYYYASSGYDYSKFKIVNNDLRACGHYDLLSLQCFSTAGLRIYSEGGEKNRIDKIADIINFKPARKHLHVCTAKPYNCGTCTKCRRTLVALDLLECLDDFTEVFNVEEYRRNKKKYYSWLCAHHYLRDVMNEPVYQGLKKRHAFGVTEQLYGILWLPYAFLKDNPTKLIWLKKIYRTIMK